MFDYISSKEWPFFKVDFTLYPNKDQQINFLSSYIDAQIQSENNSINREELINQIMKEANYFALASNFFWTLWAINMATSTAIKFGYMVGKYLKEKFSLLKIFFLGICSNSSYCLLFNT
jgi:hypothetical protein